MKPKELRAKVGALVDDLQDIVDRRDYPAIGPIVKRLGSLTGPILNGLPRYPRWRLNRTYVFIPISFDTLLREGNGRLSIIRKGFELSNSVLAKSDKLLKGWAPPSFLRHQAEEK